MLNKKKEMNNNKENDDGVVSVSDKTAETSKSSSQRAPSSTGITQASKRKSPSVSTVTPPSSMNKEMISILREMNTNLNKQSDKLEKLSQRVDYIYEYDDTCDNEGFYDEDFETVQETECLSDIVEPCAKKPRCEKFKDLSEKFQIVDKVDNEINDDLAQFVNSSFRGGINDDRASEIVRDIYRPVNCESLVKTRVNPGMWRLLKPQTQTDDSKMQAIQNLNVKSSINLVKLLDKEGDNMDPQSVEWGTNALALLGHANKLINNKRKESHKHDLDPKYYPLTSSSLPFTDNLYGDDGDINKNVKDIQDLSRIGRGRGQVPYRGYGRRRGGYRGTWRPGRGRPYFRSSSSDSTFPSSAPKNFKQGHRK